MRDEVVSVNITRTGDVLTFPAEYEEVDGTALRGRLHFIEGGRAEYLLHQDGEKHLWIGDSAECYALTVDPASNAFIARKLEMPAVRLRA